MIGLASPLSEAGFKGQGFEKWEAGDPGDKNKTAENGISIKMELKNANAQFELNLRQMTEDQAVMILAKDYTKACGANGGNFSDDVVLQAYKHIDATTKGWDNNKKGLLLSVFESGLRRSGVNVDSVKQLVVKEARLRELKSDGVGEANVASISRVQDRIRSMPATGQRQTNMLRVAGDDDWVQKAKASVVPTQASVQQSNRPGLLKRIFGGGK